MAKTVNDFLDMGGRLEDPRKVDQVLSQLKHPLFLDAAGAIKDSGKGKVALLYKYVEKLNGGRFNVRTQEGPQCVSFGAATAVDIVKSVEIILNKEREQWIAETSTEDIYGGSRIQIGNGELGYGGGSYGSFAAKYVNEIGTLARIPYDKYDLSIYNGNLAEKWGNPGNGVPDSLIKEANKHKIQTVSLITDYESCRDSLANGFSITIASNIGFQSVRDKDGFALQGSKPWPHQMCLIGLDDNPKRPGVLIQNSWGCYSDDTEILTDSGWKLFRNLSKFDMVATLNDKNNLEFQYPTAYHEYECKEKLLRFKGRNIDLLVTKNHNMYGRFINHNFEIKQASDIPNKRRFRFQKNCHGIKNGHVLYHEIGDKKIDMNVWLEFLGYFLTEGHTCQSTSTRQKRKIRVLSDGSKERYYVEGNIPQTQYTIGISQKKENGRKLIRNCLNNLGYKFSSGKVAFSANNKALYAELSVFGKAEDKFIPSYIWDCSKEQLEIFYKALMLGDGSRSDGKNTFYSSSIQLVEDFQRLLLSIGYSGDVRIVDRIGEKTTSGNNRNLLEYQVRIKEISNETCPINGWDAKEVDYDGKVYCVTVPNKIIYVRRNGNVVWCGNSNWISGPKRYEQPDGSFWCDIDVLQKILNARDSWVYSNFDGYKMQKLNLRII